MTPLRLRTALAGLIAVLAAVLTAVTGPAAPAHVTVQWSEADEVGATTTYTSTTTALYKIASYVGGKPVRWNPCAAIHWKFRTTGAPSGGFTVVKNAIARVSTITGIKFVYDGSTTATPTSSWLPRSTVGIRPVLVGWTDGAHSDLLAGRPSSVLGVTRTAYFGTTIDGISLAATKGAVIALDRTDRLPLTGGVSWNTTVLHELGHMMGLDHVGNTKQLMYPVLQRNLWGLQTGDYKGLVRLGRTSGCIDLGF
jgi:hypothetical protein